MALRDIKVSVHFARYRARFEQIRLYTARAWYNQGRLMRIESPMWREFNISLAIGVERVRAFQCIARLPINKFNPSCEQCEIIAPNRNQQRNIFGSSQRSQNTFKWNPHCMNQIRLNLLDKCTHPARLPVNVKGSDTFSNLKHE